MKQEFTTRIAAINWIAETAEDEGMFEVLREQLNFNFIYTGKYFLDMSEEIGQVIMLDSKR